MNLPVEIISIVIVVVVLALVAVWAMVRMRNKAKGESSRAAFISRREARRFTGASSHEPAEKHSSWRENSSKETPEIDRVVSSPELKNSSNQEDQVYTITPPGKNGHHKE